MIPRQLMMPFNRPINCHLNDGRAFCLGGALKSTLYVLRGSQNIQAIALAQSYDYMLGFGANIFLFDVNNGVCDTFDLALVKHHSRNKLHSIRYPSTLFYAKDATDIIFHYNPHLKLSFGILVDANGNVNAFQSQHEICGVKHAHDGRYVFINCLVEPRAYEIVYYCDGRKRHSIVPFERDVNIGFRHPTSLCLREDDFWVLDSSNYALKKFSFPLLALTKVLGGKGKDLGNFDRCNAMVCVGGGEIYLSDMNNDRLLGYDDKAFTVICERDPASSHLNRPVSFSKSSKADDVVVVCRDSNSVYRCYNGAWEKIFTKQSTTAGRLIGYEIINDVQYELLREYDRFLLNEITCSPSCAISSSEVLSIDGDIQDYDYGLGYFLFLNSTSRQVVVYDLLHNVSTSFRIFQNYNKSESLSKGISYSERGIIVVGFETGFVNIFNFDGKINESFMLPNCDDVFRKVIYLSEERFLVLSQKMVRIFCKVKARYVAELDEFIWSSPTDCVRKGFKLFITNKEYDRVEIINGY